MGLGMEKIHLGCVWLRAPFFFGGGGCQHWYISAEAVARASWEPSWGLLPLQWLWRDLNPFGPSSHVFEIPWFFRGASQVLAGQPVQFLRSTDSGKDGSMARDTRLRLLPL